MSMLLDSKALQTLNPAQAEGVRSLKGPVLILAGAGSGKTRVLTYRIAHLIESGSAFPGEIFAVTFTNKAAKEMRERVARLLGTVPGMPIEDIWITTFHSSGAKILRQYGGRVGLHPGFTIFDDSDQLSLIKDCMNRLGVSDKVVSPKSIMYRINQLKNDAIDPRDFEPGHSFMDLKMAPVLRAYEEGLLQNNAVDFGDLLFKTYKLFLNDTRLCDEFQDRYPYLLVDEYQDTNPVQYKLLRLLSGKYRNLCVVGDEDQSIYRWRGADIRNILDFEKDFPDAQVIKLEENYRSTGHIIRAASKVISYNKQRKEKTLFTSNEDGEQVEVHFLDSDFDESRWVVKSIKERIEAGSALTDIAIFYRTHAQSRLFEDVLRYERLNYKIFGGLKFYERAEIKDALAFLRLFVNPKDDVSLYRIINVPTRGIGKTTIDALKTFAGKEKVPGLEAIGMLARPDVDMGGVSMAAAARKKLQGFLEIYGALQKKLNEYSPQEFYAYLLDEIGYIKALEAENNIESVARLENLKELSSAISDYETRAKEATLSGFLEEVALINDADKVQDTESFITLMTLHSAKGLEYPVVYLVGLEEGLFPSLRMDSIEGEAEGVEEERRLCYVGMTRARKRLYMTSARVRRVFGVTQVRQPSRFIDELPAGEAVVVDHAPKVVSFQKPWRRFDQGDFDAPAPDSGFDEYFGDPGEASADPNDKFAMGKKVKHPDYGVGIIIRREGQREALKLSVKFDVAGTKKFVAKFAPLEPVL